MIGFFGIGVVINVVMITAYFIWAYKQWKKSDGPKEKKN
jgi:heme/copper-type cytochrome/quinol oxidase subunit 2